MKSKTSASKSGGGFSTQPVLLIAATVFLTWFAFGLLPFVFFPVPEKSSEYGDSFGLVNSIFSGLAFGGIIYAIILQTVELKLQREELAATRDELRRSAEAQQAMQETMRITAHLSTCSTLLDGLRPAINQDAAEFPTHNLQYWRLLYHLNYIRTQTALGKPNVLSNTSNAMELASNLNDLGERFLHWYKNDGYRYMGESLHGAIDNALYEMSQAVNAYPANEDTNHISKECNSIWNDAGDKTEFSEKNECREAATKKIKTIGRRLMAIRPDPP